MSALPEASPAVAGSKRKIWRNLILLILVVVGILAFYSWQSSGPNVETISQAQMFDLIKANRVRSLVNYIDPSSGIHHLTGWYNKPASDASNATATMVAFSVPIDLQFDPRLLDELREAGYTQPIDTAYGSNIVWPLVLNFLPIILFAGLMYLLFRKAIKLRASNLPAPPSPPPSPQ